MQIVRGDLFGGHLGWIQRPAFSPDGTQFVAGDLKGGLILRTRTGKIIARLGVPAASPYSEPRVLAVAWSPDGAHIAVHEYGSVRLRNPRDLIETAEANHVGKGPLAFGERWLAILSDGMVHLRSVPTLKEAGFVTFTREVFQYFSSDTLAAHGSLIAVGDDGGSNETAMGITTAHGIAQVTLIDADRKKIVGAIERDQGVHQLEIDPWRGRIVTSTYGDMGIWSVTGEPIRRFAPYEKTYVGAFAIAENWIATAPSNAPRLDLWNPTTLERIASAELSSVPGWIAANGRMLLTPEGNFGIRAWST
jgi:WD40 repeat protein